VTNYWATADMLAYYPETVKKWLARHGGLTADMKTVNGPELRAIIGGRHGSPPMSSNCREGATLEPMCPCQHLSHRS
jgi:hypothetical protein